MSKIRIALLGVLAAAALSAIATSSALAHEYKVAGTAVGATPFEVQAVSQDGYMETTVAGLAFYIECRSDNTSITAGTNQIEAAGASKAKVEFSNCQAYEIKEGKLIDEPECKVSEPIIAEATDKLEGLGEDKFTGSGAEETFATIAIPKASACTFTSLSALSLKVKGTELCTFPEAGVEEIVHELFCTPGGSSLKGGAETARLWSTELMKLVKAEKWSAT